MPNPATFPAPPALDGYTVEWDAGDRFGDLPEGTIFEHFRVTLDNGYVVSVARTNMQPDNLSVGFESGRWEAATMRPTTNPIAKLFGMEWEPAYELDDLNTHTVEEAIRVIGDLDNEGIVALLETVAARPAYVAPEVDETDVAMVDLDTLFGVAGDEDQDFGWSE